MLSRQPWWLMAAGVAVTLGVAYALALSSASAVAVSRHVFYLPVVLAAARFGTTGALAAGGTAAVLAGPLAPGEPAPGLWLLRGSFLLGVGLLVAVLVAAVREAARREVEVAEHERNLARQRAGLIQSVSHQFRTPLTVIYGVTETLLGRSGAVDASFRPLLEGLARSTRKLDELVSVVLAAAGSSARAEARERPVPVHRLIDDALRSIPHATGRVEVSVTDDVETLVTVPDHVHVVLRCLLDNALRFSEAQVDVHVDLRHEHLVIDVRDRGEGIDPGSAERAFQPFARCGAGDADPDPGLGLGLFAARNLARGLGGDVALTTPQGTCGAVARIVLPQRRTTDRAGCVRTS